MCVLCGELVSSFHWTDSYENDKNLKGQNTLISVNENARERKRSAAQTSEIAQSNPGVLWAKN
ncbi:hypothetical protein BTM158_04310 [Helicobacter pylori]